MISSESSKAQHKPHSTSKSRHNSAEKSHDKKKHTHKDTHAHAKKKSEDSSPQPASVSRKTMYIYAVLGISLSIFILLIGTLSYFAHQQKQYEDKIYPNVLIDGVDVGGKTKKEASAMFQKEDNKFKNLTFNLLYNDEQIATLSADFLSIRWNKDDVIEQAYTVGRSSHTPSKLKQVVYSILDWKEYPFTTSYVYDKNVTSEFIDTIVNQYDIPAQDALFEIEDGKVTAFRQHQNGREIDKVSFLETMDAHLEKLNRSKQIPSDIEIVLTDRVVEPEITLAKSNDLGIEELIGVGESDYSGSIESRIHNLTLATSKFHGVVIPPGEIISFNEIIGDISINTGYQQAYIIQNGKTVLGDGGGVCQVSTTLFRAGLNTGLPIVERHAHAYRVGYYENDSEPGFDATIYSPTVDLKMKNDTPSNILIQTEIIPEESLMYFRLYGKKDDRKVEISPVQVYDVAAPPPDKHEDDPTLPKGTVKQVDFAAWGAKASFNYKITKGGEVVQEKTFFSSYKPWAAVYLVGTKE